MQSPYEMFRIPFSSPIAEHVPDGSAPQPGRDMPGIMATRTNSSVVARGWAFYWRNALSLRQVDLTVSQARTLLNVLTAYYDMYPSNMGITSTKNVVVAGSGIPKRMFVCGNHPVSINYTAQTDAAQYAMVVTFDGTSTENITARVRGVTENGMFTEFGIPTPRRLMQFQFGGY